MRVFARSLAVELLQVSNRLLPAPSLPGDVDDLAYAQWEYDTSQIALDLWKSCAGPVHRALDVGCGLGGKTLRLIEGSDPKTSWSGLDIDRNHLHGAKRFEECRATPRSPRRTDWIQADAARLPFADARFDRIITADALEHFPEPRHTLQELRRCLDENGRLVLLFNPWFSPRGSHLGDVLHLPWCQAIFSREVLSTATRNILHRRADDETDPHRAERLRVHAQELVDHFEQHVHRTTIADLRTWLREDQTFRIEREVRVGPGPLARLRHFPPRILEEWLSATYGAVLAPLAT